MIAARIGRTAGPPAQRAAMAKALGLYGGDIRQAPLADPHYLAANGQSFLAMEGAVGAAVYGWIDNANELARELGVSPDNPAAIYAAALAAWDEGADRRISGCFAAAAILPSGELHCARSPWKAPPLHYAVSDELAVASPFLRCLFAAGVPRSYDYERLIDELAIDRREQDQRGWYADTWRVPLGGFVRLAPSQRREVVWHRPPSLLSANRFDDREAVEEALRLLDESGAKAMEWAGKPALSLSGGLDSTLAGSALLRAMPDGERLTAITWVPDREWDGRDPPGKFGDESRFSRHFVEAHPQIDWHLVGQNAGAFDRKAREVFAASECFAPGLANVSMHHDVYEKARSLGCNAVLTAEFGNVTFSEAGEAAYREYPRGGLLGQYARLIRARPNDPRSVLRRVAALTILPALPTVLRRSLRGLVHPARKDMAALFSPLSRSAWVRQRSHARERGSQAAWADYCYDRDRASAVEKHWREADGVHHDVDLAFAQIYGVQQRDVAAYGPLVEFCMSLPTRAFAWDGTERRLARRMGASRIPAEIHGNTLYGQHNVDWHVRLTRDRPRLRGLFETARDHPFLAQTLDIDRLIGMIDEWPERAGWDWDHDMPRLLAVTRALMAVRFIGALERRNDL